MSDLIIEKALLLKKEILATEEAKEYIKNKNLLENSSEIKELKKLIVRSKNENRLSDHDALLKEYNSHPLVNNYLISKENFEQLLKEIKEILD